MIPINDGCEFLGNLYQFRRDKPGNPSYTILFQLSEKINGDPAAGEPNEELISFAVMPLMNKNETLNFGDFEIELYPAPVSIPPTGHPLLGKISFTDRKSVV